MRAWQTDPISKSHGPCILTDGSLTRNESSEAIEVTFSAIWLFGQKVTNALPHLALSLILVFYGWQETSKGKVKQTKTAIQALQFSVALISLCVLILAIMALQFQYRPSAEKAQ